MPGLGYRSLWQTAVLSCTVAVVTAHKTKVLFTEGGAARAIDTNIQLANRANDIELLRFMVYNIGNDDTNLALTKTWKAGIEHQLIKRGVQALHIRSKIKHQQYTICQAMQT